MEPKDTCPEFGGRAIRRTPQPSAEQLLEVLRRLAVDPLSQLHRHVWLGPVELITALTEVLLWLHDFVLYFREHYSKAELEHRPKKTCRLVSLELTEGSVSSYSLSLRYCTCSSIFCASLSLFFSPIASQTSRNAASIFRPRSRSRLMYSRMHYETSCLVFIALEFGAMHLLSSASKAA